jgi:hypothetical protein
MYYPLKSTEVTGQLHVSATSTPGKEFQTLKQILGQACPTAGLDVMENRKIIPQNQPSCFQPVAKDTLLTELSYFKKKCRIDVNFSFLMNQRHGLCK